MNTKLSIDQKIEVVANEIYERELALKAEHSTGNHKLVEAIQAISNEEVAQLVAEIINKIAGYGNPNICHILSKKFKTVAFSHIEHWEHHIRRKIYDVLSTKIHELPDAAEFDRYFFKDEVTVPNRKMAMKYIRAIAATSVHYTFGGVPSGFSSDLQYTIYKNVLFLTSMFEQTIVANDVSLYKLLHTDYYKQLAQDEIHAPFTFERTNELLKKAAYEWYQEFNGMIDFEPSKVHYKDIPQYLHLFTKKQIELLKEHYIQYKFDTFKEYEAADKLTLPLLKIIKNDINKIRLWSYDLD